jgi:hypothetical protein
VPGTGGLAQGHWGTWDMRGDRWSELGWGKEGEEGRAGWAWA